MSARVVWVVLVLMVAAAVWRWWSRPPDAAAELAARRAPLARLERTPRPDLGARVERWCLVDARGDTAWALWRPAPRGARRAWTVVMLGGIGTGERAALLLPPDLPVHALAVDWPWRGPRRMDAGTLVRRLPAIRAALLRTPACLALGLEALAREGVADTARLALLGASLGAPPTLAALRLSGSPDALVLVDGFADLGAALRHGLVREGCPRPLAAPLAALGARLLDPLEPARHAHAIEVPVLAFGATRDERLPRASVERLHTLLPGAALRWRADTHVLPERRDLIATLARSAAAWLDSLPAR
jgi:dienelactone hydrolase